MKIKDLKLNIEYDYEDGKAYKTLKCYHTDGTVTYNRFQYAITKDFSEPYEG